MTELEALSNSLIHWADNLDALLGAKEVENVSPRQIITLSNGDTFRIGGIACACCAYAEEHGRYCPTLGDVCPGGGCFREWEEFYKETRAAKINIHRLRILAARICQRLLEAIEEVLPGEKIKRKDKNPTTHSAAQHIRTNIKEQTRGTAVMITGMYLRYLKREYTFTELEFWLLGYYCAARKLEHPEVADLIEVVMDDLIEDDKSPVEGKK